MPHMSTLPSEGYRTVAVETEIPWPSSPRTISFHGRDLQLLPESDDTARMIRIKTATDFTVTDADKIILEFLSAIAWWEQSGATATFANWCTAPLNIGKGPRGVTGDGGFGLLVDPPDPRAKLALALYREGLSVNLVPYKFLSFFKIINILRNTGPEQKSWIRDNLHHIADKVGIERIAEIEATGVDVADYLYSSGRCAIAHAFDKNNVVNPDEPADLLRLSRDLPVIRELSRVAIEREFNVMSRQ